MPGGHNFKLAEFLKIPLCNRSIIHSVFNHSKLYKKRDSILVSDQDSKLKLNLYATILFECLSQHLCNGFNSSMTVVCLEQPKVKVLKYSCMCIHSHNTRFKYRLLSSYVQNFGVLNQQL